MLRAHLAAGRPSSGESLPSFESWSRVDVLRDGAPWYGLNGCLKWGDGGRGAMCRKLLRAIEAHGWAVQSIDGDGVLVARIGGHDVR